MKTPKKRRRLNMPGKGSGRPRSSVRLEARAVVSTVGRGVLAKWSKRERMSVWRDMTGAWRKREGR